MPLTMMKTKINNYLPIVLKVILAVLLIQTLRFKFTGHEDSVYIFTTIGMEPWGRIGIGILELIASILLFIPKMNIFGILLTIGLMFGAVFMHFTKLGIVVKNDGGTLFGMAILCLFLALILLWLSKNKIRKLLNLF